MYVFVSYLAKYALPDSDDVCLLFFFNCNYFKFQSLDYDNIENQLFLEEERRMSHMVSHNSWGKKRTAKRWCTLLLCSFLFLFISLVFTLFGVFRVFVVWRSVVGWSAV